MAASTSRQNSEEVDELAYALAQTNLTSPGSSKNSNDPSQLTSEEYDDDVYEDAIDDSCTLTQEIDLEQSFVDCDKAIKLFFNNDLEGATAIMKPLSRSSLYHSLGLAIFEFIPAILTLDRAQIKVATEAVKISISICSKHRRHYTFVQSIGSLLKKPNYASYSDLEAHAELCYAEAMLLQAAMAIVSNEDYTGLIMCTFKVKMCYNSYMTCWEIKEHKKWESTSSQVHFKSGVRLGTAAFNLMISLLPPKIVTILEFVGFSGNKYYALEELEKGSNSPGMRSLLCDMTLLAYHLAICPYVGGQGNLKYAQKVLQKCLSEYPDSVWFTAFLARSQILNGNIEDAILSYKHAIYHHREFKQFRLVCYWELIWAEGLSSHYNDSVTYADILLDESSWSRTTNSYIKAAMMLQISAENQFSLGGSYKEIIDNLMRMAPTFKVRIAGKSIPMEKFAIRRCNRYYAQQCHLLLPGIELMSLWNLFPVLSKHTYHLQLILKAILRAEELLNNGKTEWMGEYRNDNQALIHYLKGCALLACGSPDLAVKEFDAVLGLQRKIKEDTFLVPYAVCEKAMCYFQMDDMEQTVFFLNEAKKKYSGYILETRLQFRVHARFDMVKGIIGATEFRN